MNGRVARGTHTAEASRILPIKRGEKFCTTSHDTEPVRSGQVSDCGQEMCVNWTGDGSVCACAVFDLRPLCGACEFNEPPGRCLVLRADGPALWVTSWPFPEYVKHRWPGAWVNSLFRREGGQLLASAMIRAAVAATRWRWPDVPPLGMVTFVNPAEIANKANPGYCYLAAGFERDGTTEGGLPAFRMRPERMPEPCPPIGAQLSLEAS